MTRTECDSLCLALERAATGAHLHTASKARFYLRELVDKPNAKFSNCSQAEFISAVNRALGLKEWERLGDLMSGWW